MKRLTLAFLLLLSAGLLHAGGDVDEIDIIVKKKPSGSGKIAATARSDSSGVFRISELPPGDYEMQLSLPTGWTKKGSSSISLKTTFISPKGGVKGLATGRNILENRLQAAALLTPGQTDLLTDSFTLTDTASLTGLLISDDIAISNTSLRFIAMQGGSLPPPQTVELTSASDGNVTYTAAFKADSRTPRWAASLSKTCCAIDREAGEEIAIQPNTAGLAPGTYFGNITIVIQIGSLKIEYSSVRTVAVTVVVVPRGDSTKLPIVMDKRMDFSPLVSDTAYQTSTVKISNTDAV